MRIFGTLKGRRADSLGDGHDPIAFEQCVEVARDFRGERQPLINHCGVELHCAGSGADLGIGLFGRADAADADQGQFALGLGVKPRENLRGTLKERLALEASLFIAVP